MGEMKYRRLGESGLAVSVVGLGCNNFGMKMDQGAADAVVGAALDAGMTLFDTSDSYGSRPGESEEMLGHALRGRRDEAIVATKFGSDLRGANGPDWGARGSRRYVRKAVDASLRRLGTDWIDLYQIHKPDPSTPIRETLTALDELVKEGKVRYAGCSNHPAWRMADAAWIARTEGLAPFVSAQDHYNLLERDKDNVQSEIIPMCERFGMSLLPYFPLASGVLTGKYRRDAPPPPGSRFTVWPVNRLDGTNWDLVEALAEFAAERDRPMIDIAIGTLTAMPVVGSVIAGATSTDQIHANVQAGLWEPTEEDTAALEDILAKY